MYAITGGSGFVGLNLIEALLGRGERVLSVSLDGLPAEARADFERLPGHLVHTIADVTDAASVEALFTEHKVARLFHGAVITAGEARERRAAADILQVNVIGATRVVEAAAKAGVRRAVVASSSAVYGDVFFGDEAVRETADCRPHNLYGVSKLATELMGRRLAALHGMSIAAARITAVMGPWERDTGLRDTLSPFFQIARLARLGQPVRIPRGGNRDWVYSRWVARALIGLLDADQLNHFSYNIAPGQTWHPERWCGHLKAAGLLPDYEVVDDEKDATVAFFDDLSRTRQPANIDRMRDFWPDLDLRLDDALADFAAWVAAHPDWFAAAPAVAKG